jgi:hypothetical protein
MAGMTIEQRIQALEDIEAIRKLKARYFHCCDNKDPVGVRSCFVDGKMLIDYGAVGCFDNADAMVKVFTDVGCHEHMVEMHHGANAQIDIVDASNARGRWSMHYFLIDTRSKVLTQLGGQYDDEYRKINGEWKVARTRFVVSSTLCLDINETSVKALFAGRQMPAG